MDEKLKEQWNQKIKNINFLLEREPQIISDMLTRGECPMPIELLKGIPLGMFHCELCGTMVVAGIPHPPIDPEWHPEKNRYAAAFYEDYPEAKYGS